MNKMKRFLDPKFIEGFLIFFIIQPFLFVSAVIVFLHGIYQSIWG